MKQQLNIRISDATRAKLEKLTADYGTRTTAVEIAIDRMYRQDKPNMDQKRNERIRAILDAIYALARGVQDPVIVNEAGTPEYISGAYLTDASYTGSRNVIHTISKDVFGGYFDINDPDGYQPAAEWAADEWDW